MAVTQHDKDNLTAAQQAAIATYTQQWNEANARGDTQGMKDAHAAAEAIRNSAGYTSDLGGEYSGAYNGGSSGSGNSGGSAYTGYSGAGAGGYDANPGFDYSSYIGSLMGAGSTQYDHLEQLLNERTNKAVSTQGLSQYANDTFAQQVRDYIAQVRQSQQNASLAQMQQYYQSMLDTLASSMYAQPSYTPSQWDTTKDALAQAALEINYDDWTKSDQYTSLAERYGHNGQLSMQDLLGQIASRTGGMASSYATTAAQQQYNEYMAQLEEAARAMCASERSDAIQNAQLAYDFADSDYQRYLDQLAQYNQDRSFGFDVLSAALAQSNYATEWQNTLDRQAISDARYADETAYNRSRDALSDSRYEDETAYNRGQTTKADAQSRIGDYLAAGGSVAGLDTDLIAASGYTQAELAALETYYAQQAAAAAAKSSGSGSGGSKTTASTNSARYSDIRKAAMAYKNIDEAADYLDRMVNSGYITEDEAADIYLVDLGGSTEPTVTASVPTTYSEFAQRTGNPNIMTENEFRRSKGTARTAGYENYQDYLAKMWEKYGG